MINAKRIVKVFNLLENNRLVGYVEGWRYQKALMEHLHQLKISDKQSTHDYLMLLEHPDVYTLGRGADRNNILSDIVQASVVRIERGGEVTYHGPGQLVSYPIIDLQQHKKDLHWYVRTLESVVMTTLAVYGIQGERSPVNSGVWIGKNKICAVGITASRWLTMHGIALNIHCDMKKFGHIIPCGIKDDDRGVTSMSMYYKEPLTSSILQGHFVRSFGEHFELDIQYAAEEELNEIVLKYPEIMSAVPNIIR